MAGASPPPPPALSRQLSSVEKDALKTALEKVVSSYLFGHSPEHFWLVYCCQALLTQIFRLVDGMKHMSYLYLLDFCWICNLFFSIKGTLLLLDAISPEYLHSGSGRSSTFGLAAFMIACGPLGCSVIAFSNAMVLHSIQHYTAVFIHLFPPLTLWTLRWHAEDVDRAWPGVFSAYRLQEVGWLEVVTPACTAYFVWWFAFTGWMLVHGRHQHKDTTGLDTVYHYTMRSNKVLANLLGLRDLKDAPKAKFVLRYMFAHAVAVNLSFANALGCYFSKVYHSFFCILILAVALWFGSVKYNKIMTRHYVKSLEALINDRDQSAKAD
mmetsp:Transcript_95935/g.273541  ORF Transcript_95935/g.273541 Transcript_95935/m.273541 type:complete len:324 (+) Transcript_95935:182-1153(+)